MTEWTAFAAITGVVLALLLAFAHLSTPPPTSGADRSPDDADRRSDPGGGGFDPADVGDLPAGVLLLNVVLSQGLFATLLVFAAWWTRVPPAALGLAPTYSPRLIATGVGVGVALWALNHLAGRAGERAGLGSGDELRAALAPDSVREWALLLLVVLPLVAAFEEFLFRAALVGALSAGFAVPPWLLALGSSAAFALGHGAQGRVGVVVTGLLGAALAAAFLATGSLFVAVVAHYLVNALEFLVHERPRSTGSGPG